MLSAIFMIAALVSVDTSTPPTGGEQSSPTATKTDKVNRFAGRPQARIAFARDVRNFQVKRDGYDDILYLETSRDRWFRAEINCIGINDPRDAHGLLPIDHSSGLDRFSRIALVGFGRQSNTCQLTDLVELTPEEALEFRLLRRRSVPAASVAPKAAPAS